jgi:hypothetical protein
VTSAKSWLKEERRKTLGDWVAVCLRCGFAVRYVDAGEAELRSRCPACGARFSSAFAVECEACGRPLRPPELLGIPIRKR